MTATTSKLPWFRSPFVQLLERLYGEPVRLAAVVVGWWWLSNLIVGLMISHDFTTSPAAGRDIDLFWLIPVSVNGWHALAHGISGALGLLAAARISWSATYLGAFGLIYASWGAVGITTGGTVGVMYGDTFGSWVHVAEGTVLIVVLVIAVIRGLRERFGFRWRSEDGRRVSTTKRNVEIKPLADYGFFGPDSITWRVYSYPTGIMLGFQRTTTVEVFEPHVLASVGDTHSVRKRPALRYDRTLQYVLTLIFANTAAVLKASDTLVKIHSRIVGKEPIGGNTYDANDPEGQLWIHLTQWHSVLYCYEKFGPGRLSEADELQYWAECAVAAEFQTIDPADVPRNRAEMRDYYARMRPRLAASEVTQEHVGLILDATDSLVARMPWPVRLFGPILRVLFRTATIATMPRWMRLMGGIRQGRIADAAAIAVLRPAFAVLHRCPRIVVAFLRQTSPNTLTVVGPALYGLKPESPVTTTPHEARAGAGIRSPREQYAELLASRQAVPLAAPRDDVRDLLPFA